MLFCICLLLNFFLNTVLKQIFQSKTQVYCMNVYQNVQTEKKQCYYNTGLTKDSLNTLFHPLDSYYASSNSASKPNFRIINCSDIILFKLIENLHITHPKGFGLCVSKECNWHRLFFLLFGMASIMSFSFDLQKHNTA